MAFSPVQALSQIAAIDFAAFGAKQGVSKYHARISAHDGQSHYASMK